MQNSLNNLLRLTVGSFYALIALGYTWLGVLL